MGTGHAPAYLADAPALELSAERPAPSGPPPALKHRDLRVAADQSEMLLPAFLSVVGRYADADDIAFGMPHGGGLLSPIRVSLAGDPTFAELVSRVRAATASAGAHGAIDLTAEARHPVAQLRFSTQDEDRYDDPAGLELGLVAGADRTRLWYRPDLFDDAAIDRLAEHLDIVLAAGAADPGLHLSELPLLSERELDQVLVSGTTPPFHRDPSPACTSFSRLRRRGPRRRRR